MKLLKVMSVICLLALLIMDVGIGLIAATVFYSSIVMLLGLETSWTMAPMFVGGAVVITTAIFLFYFILNIVKERIKDFYS